MNPLQPVRAAALPPADAPLPEGVYGGAHADLLAPGTVTFVFHAPYKPYVALVGDFNQWDTRRHPLRDAGGGRWHITLPHPGWTRYGYYVAVDNAAHAWVGDPYARHVEWQGDTVWAHLTEPGGRPFVWHDANWKTPPLRDLIIYELCVRDFGGRWVGSRPHYGTLGDVQEHIHYLADLGVNALEIMPIQAFPGDSSWGYNPVFYFAPARTYGSANDLRALVDACHGAGMAVILDVAFNHAWGQHPWYNIYPAMYGPNGEYKGDWNPFFHNTPNVVNGWGGVDWDHFVPQTTRYFQDVVRFWLREYHVDGFRFDWVCGVDYDTRAPLAPGFNPYHGIGAIAWAARQAKPDCILIGEYWQLEGTHPDKTAAKLLRETELDAVWNGTFHHTLDSVINQRWQWEQQDICRAIGGFRDLGYTRATQVINYTASHDEVRPEHEIRYYSGKHIPRPGGIRIEELALRLARLGLVALLGGAGVPMLYSGQEYGEASARTIDFLPLEWRLLDKPANRDHFETVRRLLHARRAHPALRSDNIQFDASDYAARQLLRFWRWDGAGDAAAVALNFAPAPRRMILHLPFGGRWRDVVSDRTHTIPQGPITINLEPFGAALWVPE